MFLTIFIAPNHFIMRTKFTANLFCSTFGHNYIRIDKSEPGSPELRCKCCLNQFTYDSDGRIVNVSSEHLDTPPSLQF